MSPFHVLRNRNFRLYILARLVLVTAGQMLFVAIGWQVYALTGSELHLGLVGLAGFLPSLIFALPGGHMADRVERRRIMMGCAAASAAATAALAGLARDSVAALYAMSALMGTLRSFNAPASQSILPTIVPRDIFPRAVAWGLIVFQVAVITGPGVGGVLIDLTDRVHVVYGAASVLYVLAFFALAALRPTPSAREPSAVFGTAVADGLRYVWRQKVLFGAMSLDLFAVLLGGATALLPVFANDILKEGPSGLGFLRSAFAVGAGTMALLLALRPLTRRLGPVMFGGVAVFGLA
ncbi:MAG TPA: MFS transporter, partial [Planctomycetota bacterium]|nr:MFS transporter [Planctomycetota bacterium]